MEKPEGKITLVRLRPRWEDNIKIDLQVGWRFISGVPRNFFFRGGVSTNSVEDRGQRERDLGAVAP